jgi:methionyl-tRNA formyltransferase
MRSVLIGAVESTEVALRTMTSTGWRPDLIVTLPPERQDRHSDFVDLSDDARRLDISICHSANVNDEGTRQRLEALAPDYIFVIGWSQICGPRLLKMAARGTIGYHPAPLPHMRGRAVIPWTILQRETRSGSTLFWIDEGMDTGPILAQRLFDLDCDETAASLYQKHMQALAAMLPDALDALRLTKPPRSAQDHSRATYCARRRPEDGLIDWQKPADEVMLLIRAVGPPYPGAFTIYRDHKLTVFDARLAADGHRYIGLPGQIQAVEPDRLVVCCGDGQCLEISKWSFAGGGVPKLHSKLGAA